MSDVQSAVLDSIIIVTFVVNICTIISILRTSKQLKEIAKDLKDRKE